MNRISYERGTATIIVNGETGETAKVDAIYWLEDGVRQDWARTQEQAEKDAAWWVAGRADRAEFDRICAKSGFISAATGPTVADDAFGAEGGPEGV